MPAVCSLEATTRGAGRHQRDPQDVPRGAQGRQEAPQVGRVAGRLGHRADRRDDAVGALLDEGLEAFDDAGVPR